MPTLNLPSHDQMQAQVETLTSVVGSLDNAVKELSNIASSVARIADTQNREINPAIPYVQRRRKDVTSSTVSLYWKEPDASFGNWTQTIIVKKYRSAPLSLNDGIIVCTNNVRDTYADTPYVDAQTDGSNWHYRAFVAYDSKVKPVTKLNDFEFWIFGCAVDDNDPVPSTRIRRIEGTDNSFFADKPHMDFEDDVFDYGSYSSWDFIPFRPKPCMLKYTGVVDYYLDVNDYTKREDGVTASDVTDTSYEGNAMNEWPRIWMKSYVVNNIHYWYICSEQLDSGFECWPCKKADGTYSQYFYMPLYEGSSITTGGVARLRSMSTNAVSTGDTTADTEATRAAANGEGWYTTTWAQESLLRVVYGIFFLNANSQGALSGVMTQVSTLQRKCGELNTAGMFYGKTGAYSSKFFGMENWWGHRGRRLNGLMLKNGEYYVKLTEHMADGSSVSSYNHTAEGYIATGVTPMSTSESYIKTVCSGRIANINDALTGTPATGGSSSTTYYCDAYVTSLTGVTQAVSGGASNYGTISGVFEMFLHYVPSGSYWGFGASPSYTMQ